MPPKTQNLAVSSTCPCGSLKSLGECCLPFIRGQLKPLSAEQLMRSRYTAHALLEIDYLWDTWSPEQRVRSSPADIHAWAESCEWLGLQILATEKGQANDDTGIVEFIALFHKKEVRNKEVHKKEGRNTEVRNKEAPSQGVHSQNELHQHHERSLFKKALGQWLYIDHQA
jgi:SEC-C motif-containing protein